jgi:glycosyltransferase involved in cell wall biosynthesis
MYKISVIIPCRNEEKYIAKCLDSVVNSDYPKDLTEVFVIDGLSTDSTISIIKRYSEKYHFINLIINKKKNSTACIKFRYKNFEW